MSDTEARRTSEEAARNTPALLDALAHARAANPCAATRALELGSGSGEHVSSLARHFPELAWQPSDPDPVQRASVVAWTRGLPRVAPPLALDGAQRPWPLAPPLALVLAIHVLHLAPRALVEALAAESARLLAPGGLVVVHDAFLDEAGRAPSPRMDTFHRTLIARDPDHGLRRRVDVEAALRAFGLWAWSARRYDGDQHTLVFVQR